MRHFVSSIKTLFGKQAQLTKASLGIFYLNQNRFAQGISLRFLTLSYAAFTVNLPEDGATHTTESCLKIQEIPCNLFEKCKKGEKVLLGGLQQWPSNKLENF